MGVCSGRDSREAPEVASGAGGESVAITVIDDRRAETSSAPTSDDGIEGSSADPFQYKSEYGYRSDGDGAIADQDLIKVGARYYDPVFGRFISRDSDLAQSPYSYCNGDPLNEDDPSGHLSIGVSWGAFAMFGNGYGADIGLNIGNDGFSFDVDGYEAVGPGFGAGWGWSGSISPNGNAASTGEFGILSIMAFCSPGIAGQLGVDFGGGSSSVFLSAGLPGGGVVGAGIAVESGLGYSLGISWSSLWSGIKSAF